jgi:hypothetical protein
VPVELLYGIAVDVEREHQDRAEPRRNAEHLDERQIAAAIGAAVSVLVPVRRYHLQLGIALDESKTEEQEQTEREQPERRSRPTAPRRR